MAQQDPNVLDGRDQVILDLLAPKSSPPGTFEVMVIGRIREAALHQIFTAKTILFGQPTLGLMPGPLD